MVQEKKPKKAKHKKRRRRRPELMPVAEVLQMLPFIFDNIIAEVGGVESEEAKCVAEAMVMQSVQRLAKTADLPPERFLLITPTDKTIRLIGAIRAHADHVGKSDDAVIDKLIVALGSDAAKSFLLN